MPLRTVMPMDLRALAPAPLAISVNKHTAWLVFSPPFGVATADTSFDYAPAAAP